MTHPRPHDVRTGAYCQGLEGLPDEEDGSGLPHPRTIDRNAAERVAVLPVDPAANGPNAVVEIRAKRDLGTRGNQILERGRRSCDTKDFSQMEPVQITGKPGESCELVPHGLINRCGVRVEANDPFGHADLGRHFRGFLKPRRDVDNVHVRPYEEVPHGLFLRMARHAEPA